MSDLTWEIIGLGIDVLVCGLVYQVYKSTRDTIAALKSAVPLDISHELYSVASTTPSSTIPYGVVKGTVKAIGEPIRSLNSTVTGVIQKVSKIEHKTAYYHPSGFWIVTIATGWNAPRAVRGVDSGLLQPRNRAVDFRFDKEHVIQSSSSSVPWVLGGRNTTIEVKDSMFADSIDLQSVVDMFEPTPQSLTGFLAGWMSGERVTGLQHLEEMLVEGSLVTVFGEIVAKNGELYVQPPTAGQPYIITTMSISSTIKSFQAFQSRAKFLLIIPTGIGIVLLFLITRRLYKAYADNSRKKREEILREQIRRERRDLSELRDNQVCVACLENPREVILLPCGHVCTCIDCAEMLTDRRCPVCRTGIDSFVRAFFS